ncbi:hypothetical protein ACVWZK_007073 [Bradyrhizobium sp. GM0.4]
MDELIGRLATNASIDSAVAEKTVGIILGFLRNEGPSDSVQVLIDQIPGAEAAIEASGTGGGLSRLMGGGLMAVGTRLMGLGLGMSEIQNIARELFSLRPRQNRSGSDGQDHRGDPGPQPVRLTPAHFTSSIMTYPISEIEGLSAFAANKLKAQGIRTTDALLEAASTVKGRKALSVKTGISEQLLLEWANVSDYMRIPGMGRAKVGLVRAAGVTTVRELAYRNPARLAQSMRDANEKKKLLRILPSEKSVGDIIAKAKKLPPKISY